MSYPHSGQVNTVPGLCALLLAGGEGTRIRALFPDIPKPMIPIGGLPVSEWIIRLWANQGVTRFILSTGYRGNVIADYFSVPRFSGLRIECLQEAVPLGTAGAITFVARQTPLSDPFLVGNADSLSQVDLEAGLHHLADTSADVLIFTAEKQDTFQYGRIVTDAQSTIVAFEEKVPGRGQVNAGVYLFRLHALQRFAEQMPLSLEHDVFPKLLKEGVTLCARPLDVDFLDIGTPSGYAAADAFLKTQRLVSDTTT